MADILMDPNKAATFHSKLLAAYAVDENAVLEQLNIIQSEVEQTDSLELRYLLAKAFVFGNLVNIKWLYYHNQLNQIVEQNIQESNTAIYHINYLHGVKLYSEIIKSFDINDGDDSLHEFDQYIAYELYRILCMSDEFRRILHIPLHSSFPVAVQGQLDDLKTYLVRILGRVGYPSILVDYNDYFIRNNENLSPQQILTILNNYELVVSEFGIPLHIQDQARQELFYIYLKGSYGIPINQEKALGYLDNSIDNHLLEAVGFDLYYGSNPLIQQDKKKAQSFFSRCYANSDKVQAWSKINEPTWHAEFERRSKALENFFKLGTKK